MDEKKRGGRPKGEEAVKFTLWVSKPLAAQFVSDAKAKRQTMRARLEEILGDYYAGH